jgi:nucleoside-diphosphate-sugar epimerase
LRYLVTGGAGFIGSNIVDELVRRGHEVVVLDNLSAGKEENLAGVRKKIEFRAESITDLAAVQSASKGADYVIHLAARTSVPRSVQNPLETNSVNIDGTLNVLVAARDAKVRRFVYAASSSAYGETPTLPKTEAMQPAPISPYGVTKYVGEIYAQVFGRVYGLENASVRFFNVFGPRQDPTSQYSGVLSRFMLAVIEGKQPVIYGDGEQSRDFTYIDNIVDETLRACESKGAS